MTIRKLATGYAVLSWGLACVLPVIYLVTWDSPFYERLPIPALCLILLLEFPLIPAGMILGLILLWRRGSRGSGFGAAVGLACGLWLTTIALGIPYCGFYRPCCSWPYSAACPKTAILACH